MSCPQTTYLQCLPLHLVSALHLSGPSFQPPGRILLKSCLRSETSPCRHPQDVIRSSLTFSCKLCISLPGKAFSNHLLPVPHCSWLHHDPQALFRVTGLHPASREAGSHAGVPSGQAGTLETNWCRKAGASVGDDPAAGSQSHTCQLHAPHSGQDPGEQRLHVPSSVPGLSLAGRHSHPVYIHGTSGWLTGETRVCATARGQETGSEQGLSFCLK